MKHSYIRIWPTGPTREAQLTRLTPFGLDPERLHVDDQRPSRRRRLRVGETSPTPRERAIICLRAGDILLVACPAVLGNSFDDVMKILAWIEERQAALFDAELAAKIDGLAVSMDYARMAVKQLAAMRTSPARRAFTTAADKGGRTKIELRRPLKVLLDMWKSPSRFTVDDVAREAGLGRSTTYRLFAGIPRGPDHQDAEAAAEFHRLLNGGRGVAGSAD